VEALAGRERLRALLDAGIALSSELSLDAVLQKIVETAAELTGARYAALGVIDRSGAALERFVFTGLDEKTAEQIGHLPRGRGILGVLIRDARPLRLSRLQDHPDSVGFPAHHPPMTAFLGVPVRVRGVAYGNLYLTEKQDGEFTQEDEDLITLLASQAAVAIENARLYESVTGWSRQLESLNEVGNALVTEMDLPRLLELVARRLRELLEARIVQIWLPASDGRLRVEAADGERAADLVGRTTSTVESKTGRIFTRGSSARVDALVDDPEVNQERARMLNATSGLWVPMVVRGQAIGVISAFDKQGGDPRFGDDDIRLAETFAPRAAVAVDLSQRVSRDALRRAVEAQELERRRLARELHDELGQVLTSILLGLRAAEEAPSDEDARRSVAELRELVHTTLQDVRRLAVELRPKALDDFGLVPALRRLAETFAEQSGLSVEVEDRLDGARLSSEVETTLYRIVQEGLTNVVKHARASSVSILLVRRAGSVAVVIEDDGQGFEPDETRDDGFGLVSIKERLALVDGSLDIESGESGTTLRVEVPLS
jgi:signal transduction histidine kinase